MIDIDKVFKVDCRVDNNLVYASAKQQDPFESQYLKVRQSEGRLYTDEEVLKLPTVPRNHQLLSEWKIRQWSLDLVVSYLGSLDNTNRILDLACGNGWMSSYLYQQLGSEVLGCDLNEYELRQAVRLFSSDEIKFAYADVEADLFRTKSFDVIILAASVQYFEDVQSILGRLLELLKKGGRIIVIDSPWYKTKDAALDAKTRSQNYYESHDVKALSDFYHHHVVDDLKAFEYRYLYNPDQFFNYWGRKLKISLKSPFPIIEIVATK